MKKQTTKTKILYLDCFAGISGDMFTACLLELGLDFQLLQRELSRLNLPGWQARSSQVNRGGLQATRFEVLLEEDGDFHPADDEFVEITGQLPAIEPDLHYHENEPHHHPHEEETHEDSDEHHNHSHGRSLSEILFLINSSSLSESIKSRAGVIFSRLGQAEAEVHGVSKEDVMFHEVGGIDAIIDITAAAIGLEFLEIGRVIASPPNLGSGFIRSSHGILPVPAPATARLLEGIPVYSSGDKGELVTPTGAAILTTICTDFRPMPLMQVQKTGNGAGSRQRPFPNILRGFLGELVESSPGVRIPRDPYPQQHLSQPVAGGWHESNALAIEASIDDMNPQFCENLTNRLLSEGALDVLFIPAFMKKSRPGLLLQVLVHPDSLETILNIIFTESTSIGVRTWEVTKRMLQREERKIDTPWGNVRVKFSRLGERIVNIAPEYEDCLEISRRCGIPLKEVHTAVLSSTEA